MTSKLATGGHRLSGRRRQGVFISRYGCIPALRDSHLAASLLCDMKSISKSSRPTSPLITLVGYT